MSFLKCIQKWQKKRVKRKHQLLIQAQFYFLELIATTNTDVYADTRCIPNAEPGVFPIYSH